MSNEFNNPRKVVNLVKKIKGAVYSLNIENALSNGLRKPKMILTVVQPAPEDAKEKYQVAKYFLGVSDVISLSDRLLRIKPTEQRTELCHIYQGSHNKKRNALESRVLTVAASRSSAGKEYYTFQIENCLGRQSTTKNGAGEDVPGVVMPVTGANAQVFAKCSYPASKEEVLEIANMLRMELQGWRTAVNFDMYFHPEKFRPQYDQSGPPTVVNFPQAV